MVVLQPLLDLVYHPARLVLLVEGGIKADWLTFGAGGPEVLAHAGAVVRDQAVGGLENGGGGTVVLFQAYDSRVIVLVKAADVFHPGAAPTVNRLVVIADHEHVAARL